ncbi:MAG: NADH-quinone oxidoreductase subunit N [Thermodesulfobacteriota bacterium]
MTDWTLFIPELYTLAAAGVFFILCMAGPDPRRDYAAALALSAAGLVLTVLSVGFEGLIFADVYRIDLYSQVFKVLVYSGFFLAVCLCSDLSGVDEARHGEFYLLLALSTLAMMLLVSSVHLLTIYIALELSSYSLYVLVYLRRGYEKGVESALKYFLTGAASSALMLFGFALVYGSGGSAYVADLMQSLPARINEPLVFAGFVLSLSGFFFKLAVFPFHLWAPDAYEGAPHQVSGYIATASKVAAIAVLMRFLAISGGHGEQIAWLLIALAIASMTAGNLAAVAQKDLKRLLAFSSVAHAGYVMIGILCLNPQGYTAAVFYALSLLVMKFTCFMIVVKASYGGRNININELAGLHYRAPVLALALLLALFGLAGIPPTIGFTAKLLVFKAAMDQGLLWLVIIAMFNVVISLYYYLLVLKAAYYTEPEVRAGAIAVAVPFKLLAAAMIFLMVAGGLYPAPVIGIAESMTAVLLPW